MDLSQIPQQLLEKVVTKLDWKSYFRLQQTCHDMADFFRTSRNIQVHLPDNFDLHIVRCRCGSPEYYLGTNRDDFSIENMEHLDSESLYGARFDGVYFGYQWDTTTVIDYCDDLIKYRISSRMMDADLWRSSSLEDEKNYEKLMKILKPVKVRLLSVGSNRWEALLNAKQLKELSIVEFHADDLDLHVVKALLEKCHELDIHAYTNTIDTFYRLASEILEYLCSEQLPNLRSFIFRGTSQDLEVVAGCVLYGLFPKYRFTQLPSAIGMVRKYKFDFPTGHCNGRLCDLIFRNTFNEHVEIHFRDAHFIRHD